MNLWGWQTGFAPSVVVCPFLFADCSAAAILDFVEAYLKRWLEKARYGLVRV